MKALTSIPLALAAIPVALLLALVVCLAVLISIPLMLVGLFLGKRGEWLIDRAPLVLLMEWLDNG